MAVMRIALPRALPQQQSMSKNAAMLEVVGLVLVFAVLLQNLALLVRVPKVNADSGTALTIALSLSRGDPDPLINTLSPPFQTGTYAFLLAVGWQDAIAGMPIILALALALGLSWLGYRATGSVVGAAAPLVVLLFSSIFWEQMGMLTFYPLFAFLGYAGIYFAGRYILEEKPELRVAFAGGVLLGASLYAFTTALLFLPIPGLLWLCFATRERFLRTLKVYGFVLLATTPWFIWHLWVGGAHFYYHPLNWSNEQMLPIVNSEFWHYERESLSVYARSMADVGFDGLMPKELWPFVILGSIKTFVKYGWRAVLFLALASLFFAANLAFVRPSPFIRYFYPIFPLVVLLTAIGIHALWELVSRWESPRYLTAIVAVFALSTALLFNLKTDAVSFTEQRIASRWQTNRSAIDMRAMAKIIQENDRGTIGRDSAIQPIIPDNQTHTQFLLDEMDYVTYLSWRDEQAAIDVLNQHDIGWVILYKDAERWERDYHVWLDRVHGVPPRHFLEIPKSPRFSRKYDGRMYQLYKLEVP